MEHIDFTLALVIIVLAAGIILLANKVLSVCNKKNAPVRHNENAFISLCRSVFFILFAVLIFRSFVFEPFQIPSGSMRPTLKAGDFILVNKFIYGLRLPVTGTKIVTVGKLRRGDVIVFKFPEKMEINYIKRVVGLPGDLVSYQNGKLVINGKPVFRKLIPSANTSRNTNIKPDPTSPIWQQTLGTHTFQIKGFSDVKTGSKTEWKVPEGKYFVMGDNRDHSYDSRFWGFVPEKNIIGKAFYLWMHWTDWNRLPSLKYNGVIP